MSNLSSILASMTKHVEDQLKKQEEIELLQQQLNEYEKADLYTQKESATDEKTKEEIDSLIAEMLSVENKITNLGGSTDSYEHDASNAFTQGSIASESGTESYKGQVTPSQQNAPNRISNEFMTTLLANGNGNVIEVVDINGHTLNNYNSSGLDITKGETLKAGDIVQYGGVSYVAVVDGNGEVYGERLMDYGTKNHIRVYDGDYDSNDSSYYGVQQVTRIEEEDGSFRYVITVEYSGSSSDDDEDDDYDYEDDNNDYYEPDPTPPPKPAPVPKPEPPKIIYKNISLYSYAFGIDSLSVSYKSAAKTATFVSDYIDIGTIHDTNYISLEANEYVPEHTSIEYYLIDNNQVVPIINRDISYIEEELLFPNLPTRFAIKDNSYVIKKNFQETNLTLSSVDFSNKNDIYTISYTPVIEPYKPKNQRLKVKIIIRKYLDDIASPYISTVNLIKTGGGLLWEDISMT